jgi:hypothetical protein
LRAGTQVYAPRYRDEWLNKIEQAGVRRRAELFYQQLDALECCAKSTRELLVERKHGGNLAAPDSLIGRSEPRC